jgi:hypothetical protein
MANGQKFRQFRIDRLDIGQINREFDLVREAFGSIQAKSGNKGDKGDSGTGTNKADLYLSYGDQSGLATLPSPPEGSPAFFLRADTNQTVIENASGSPGSFWEFPIHDTVPSNAAMDLRIRLYYCALSPAGMLTPKLFIYVTKNGSVLSPFTANLDGSSGSIHVSGISHGGYSPSDTWGIYVGTLEVGSGALMCTAHASLRW